MADGNRSDIAAKGKSKDPAYPKKVVSEYLMFVKLFGNELVEKAGK